MNVTLREKKISNGQRLSLYLDIYFSKERRWKEFLDIQIIAKPKNTIEREKNKELRKLAEMVCAKRLIAIKSNTNGITPNQRIKADFMKYFDSLVEKRKKTGTNCNMWISTQKHLHEFLPKGITFAEVNEKFMESFKEHLLGKVSTNSAASYFNIVKHSIHQAFRDKQMADISAVNVASPQIKEPQKEFLTLDELKTLAKADCKYPILKRSFLFSTFTGLRWSDIVKLTWSEIRHSEELGWHIVYRQKKTGTQEYMPITEQALTYIGEKGERDEKVFIGLKYSAVHNAGLKVWVSSAGIKKHITFHCARHTFATLQLSFGTDIYTVSKLLGHSDVKTTEIYAKIVDETKRLAVDRLPNIALC